MQPFDALTMRATICEAQPLLLNRKIDKIFQTGRDEIILAFRLKTGAGHLRISAHASFGRICLTSSPQLPKGVNPPSFCQVLRKHLSGATLLEMRQVPGERVTDFVFSCVDELGTRTVKVLSAEIMGRHSNLIFWDKQSKKIIGSSHVVTAEMSRHREVAPGLKYIRPPEPDKINIFQVQQDTFKEKFSGFAQKSSAEGSKVPASQSIEQWLMSNFSGLGRHLSEELVASAEMDSAGSPDEKALWSRITQLQNWTEFKPAMRDDLTKFTVLGWLPELARDSAGENWKVFSTVNDLVETYFRSLQKREQLQQLKDRIKSALHGELDKAVSRLSAAINQLSDADELEKWKKFGDLILANSAAIEPGQELLECDDLYADGAETKVQIPLNPNLNAAQNSQHYYRQFAKGRTRHQAASQAKEDAEHRKAIIEEHLSELEEADEQALAILKEQILDRGKNVDKQKLAAPSGKGQPKAISSGSSGNKTRLMNTKSADGWLIYIGRNRNENDLLLTKLAQPHDLWLHVLGQQGAHVLIKNPNKQDPPLSTIKEAAQLAARFSRISLGTKVRVIYTHCKYVRKLGKDKPGMVRYENEKTLEVDTSAPMTAGLRRLFAN